MTNYNTAGYTADSKRAIWNQGDKVQKVRAIAPITAAMNDGDTIILARNIPMDAIVNRITLPKGNAGITAGTDYDIGFYKSDGDSLGVVLDKDALVDGLDASAALTYAKDICESDPESTIADLLSLQSDKEYVGGVHIVLTLNTAGSEAQDLDFDIELVMAG